MYVYVYKGHPSLIHLGPTLGIQAVHVFWYNYLHSYFCELVPQFLDRVFIQICFFSWRNFFFFFALSLKMFFLLRNLLTGNTTAQVHHDIEWTFNPPPAPTHLTHNFVFNENIGGVESIIRKKNECGFIAMLRFKKKHSFFFLAA